MQVAVTTVKALMTGDALRRGVPPAPRFCASAECSVVYFDDVSDRKVDENELTVRVFAKHPHDPSAPACYCFGYTREAIEIAAARQTARVSDAIRAEVEAGHCACEVKNPRGTCCFGDITRVERAIDERRIDGNTKKG